MTEVDYVVVGAGTAGCALAARLAEDPSTSVALLEAGGRYRRVLDVPLVGMWAWLRKPQAFCWEDWTVPQPALDGRRVSWPAGRLVGGSSAINAMIYSRGAAESYDRWSIGEESREGPRWNYAALLPYFQRSEEQEGGESAQHGVGGPIAVSDSRYVNGLSRAFVAGCEEIGIPPTDDFNGPRCDGAGFFQVTQRRGRRSGARDYLTRTAGGSRVSLHLRSRAVRLVIENGRVSGVDVVSDGKLRRLHARRETILCAGVVRSPQLLMLSGIGSGEALTRLGIRVHVDNPGVGGNLQDHVRIPVIREWGGDRPSRALGLMGGGLRYLWSRRGLLTSNVCDAAAIVKPDGASVPSLRIVCQWRALPEARQACVSFEVVLIDPCSRGQVSLASSDPDAAMRIDPSYLGDSRDLARLVHGVELARAIAESGPCRQAGVGLELLPGSESVADYARRQANSAYHPVGTCRLGTTASAVVDPHLRVIGIRGLRVADASVMPTTVAGNAQAAVFAIAERAADLIRKG